VHEGEAVQRGEDHVEPPVDAPQQRRDGEGERAVPPPVGCRGEGNGLGPDLGGKDFGGVGPRCGTLWRS
jgi:hypothetical protein